LIPKDKIKLKKCKVCKQPFMPRNTIQPTCYDFECQATYATAHAKKVAALREKRERQALREAKERLKPRGDYIKELQRWFNRFVRLRDAHLPCISCDRFEVEMTIGGAWDCGHFQSVGARPELRFEELNAHKQCKSCNGGSGKYARKNYTVAKEYEERLIKRIGQDKVDWLKGPHPAKHYTIDELKQLTAHYKMKCKQLSKGD